MKKAGILKENITRVKAERNMRSLLPEGLSTKGHHIMQIVERSKVVVTV